MNKEIMNLDYPKNLDARIFGKELESYPEDFEASVQYLLYNLKEDYRIIIEHRFNDKLSLAKIGELMNLSRETIRNKEWKAVKILSHPSNSRILKYGIKAHHQMEVENLKNRYEEKLNTINLDEEELKKLSIDEIVWKTNEINCIIRCLYNKRALNISVAELIEVINNGKLANTRNCGFSTMRNIIIKLYEFGIRNCIEKEILNVYFKSI